MRCLLSRGKLDRAHNLGSKGRDLLFWAIQIGINFVLTLKRNSATTNIKFNFDLHYIHLKRLKFIDSHLQSNVCIFILLPHELRKPLQRLRVYALFISALYDRDFSGCPSDDDIKISFRLTFIRCRQ